MLEEEGRAMEKKFGNRPTSVTPKGNCPDVKKDGGRFPRNGRRRENNNNVRPPYDNQGPPRRPGPQRFKGQDKRPLARRNPMDNRDDEVTFDCMAEAGSAMRPGSKKGSLNHLLNFTYVSPRDCQDDFTPAPRYRSKWSIRNKAQYSKEQFLQASCQFVVRDGEDYAMHTIEPDRLVDWDHVEQVRVLTNEVPSCPICLYPPTAAKITRCGHIYCWSCILHYLSLGEKPWRKCPICYESVQQNHLKSVMSLQSSCHRIGDEITLSLMRREKDTILFMPKSQWDGKDVKFYNVTDTTKQTNHCKLLLATIDQVQDIIDAERLDLDQQLKEEGSSSLEGSYISSAMNLLNEREKALHLKKVAKKVVLDTEQLESNFDEKNANLHSSPSWTRLKDCVEYASAFSDEEVEVEQEADVATSPDAVGNVCAPLTSPEDPGKTQCTNPTESEGGLQELPPSPEDESHIPVEVAVEELAQPVEDKRREGEIIKDNAFYFYQASDGQQIYIHSLNTRCLVKEYGSLANCPDTITAKIVEMERVTMTVELRKRLRYLSHLPLTCEFQVAEVVLKPPLVSERTLNHFADDIERRRKMRQKKSREDKKRSKKIEEEEKKKMGIFPGAKIRLNSSMHFPENNTIPVPGVHDQDTPSSSSMSTPIGSPGILNPRAAEFVPGGASSSSLGSVDDSGIYDNPVSFAQMLRQGQTRPSAPAWPKSGPLAIIAAAEKPRGESDQSDCEDRIPVPGFQASFGDAIQNALDNYVGKSDGPMANDQVAPSSGKKKKKQKKLLFTTSMVRKN